MDLRKYIPRNFKNKLHRIILGYTGFNPCFSQGGEDMILRTIFKGVDKGFFIDVGAYHPTIGSNTYFLYRTQGWRGINIDPNTENIDLFNKKRPEDTNINIAIGKNEGSIFYYQQESPSMNFCSKEEQPLDSYKSRKSVIISPLSAILKPFCKKTIDLMTIDVEGYEFDVLTSNDWNLYRPKVIVIEQSIQDICHGTCINYLKNMGYHIFSFSTLGIHHGAIMCNLFFADLKEFPFVSQLPELETNLYNSKYITKTPLH
ncbi:FkbM family methyltransferase [Reichenbachiella sp. MALMAid0571]|uniref:FkbM family methyltransferase n=1 Tax=Reichenbachiella sp. MALMAid0571 TaxID=3143939 RepID=UPI0032E04B25